MESNTDDIKISGEKKGSNNIININKNNEDLKEKDILYSSIKNKKMENSLIKQFENFSSATHTNFPSGNKSKKAEKYYIEEILYNKCENKNKQIIHYIYYENEKQQMAGHHLPENGKI